MSENIKKESANISVKEAAEKMEAVLDTMDKETVKSFLSKTKEIRTLKDFQESLSTCTFTPNASLADIKATITHIAETNDPAVINPVKETVYYFLTAALEYKSRKAFLEASTRVKTSRFRAGTEFEGKEIGFKVQKVHGANGHVSGNQAVALFYSGLGLGNNMTIPLWHSGFTVTVRPFGETALTVLDTLLGENKMALGRSTNGLIFSNQAYVFEDIVSDFVIENIVTSTLDLGSLPKDKTIRDYIALQDIQAFYVLLINATFPNGYKNITACKNVYERDPEHGDILCDRLIEGIVDPISLWQEDESRLSEKALSQMSRKRPGTVSLLEADEYRKNLNHSTNVVTVSNNNELTFDVLIKYPTLAESSEQGEIWKNHVENAVEQLLTNAGTPQEKTNAYKTGASLAMLSSFTHWIAEFRMPTAQGVAIISEPEDKKTCLEGLIYDEAFFANFLSKIRGVIDKSVVAVVGLPIYTCPKCQKKVEGTIDTGIPEVITLDALTTFFSLRTLRTTRTLETIKNDTY